MKDRTWIAAAAAVLSLADLGLNVISRAKPKARKPSGKNRDKVKAARKQRVKAKQ